MKKVKIVKEFFGLAAAKAQATWQRAKAKKEGRQIHKIEIVPAYELFKTNGWFKNNPFKKIGIPAPEQYMVIVHYAIESPVTEPVKELGAIIKSAKSSKCISQALFIVRLPLTISYFFDKPVRKSIRISCPRYYHIKVA
jgi:hypothetical protein